MERNVCFVDTPGHSSGLSMMETIESVLHYVEVQLSKETFSASIGKSELVNMLSGKGGAQVDVALYMIAQSMSCFQSHVMNIYSSQLQNSCLWMWNSFDVYQLLRM